jgi:hypothetical protein
MKEEIVYDVTYPLAFAMGLTSNEKIKISKNVLNNLGISNYGLSRPPLESRNRDSSTA